MVSRIALGSIPIIVLFGLLALGGHNPTIGVRLEAIRSAGPPIAGSGGAVGSEKIANRGAARTEDHQIVGNAVDKLLPRGRLPHGRKGLGSLVPAKDIQVDLPTLRGEFNATVSDLNLSMTEDVDVDITTDPIKQISMVAVRPSTEPNLAGPLFLRRDWLFAATPELGSVLLVRSDTTLATDGEGLLLRATRQFTGGFAQLGNRHADIAGLVIDVRSAITLPDSGDTSVQALGDFNGLASQLVRDEQVTFNWNGRSLSFSPGDRTFREAIQQLGLNPCTCTGFCVAEHVPDGFGDCFRERFFSGADQGGCVEACVAGNVGCFLCVVIIAQQCGFGPYDFLDLVVCLLNCTFDTFSSVETEITYLSPDPVSVSAPFEVAGFSTFDGCVQIESGTAYLNVSDLSGNLISAWTAPVTQSDWARTVVAPPLEGAYILEVTVDAEGLADSVSTSFSVVDDSDPGGPQDAYTLCCSDTCLLVDPNPPYDCSNATPALGIDDDRVYAWFRLSEACTTILGARWRWYRPDGSLMRDCIANAPCTVDGCAGPCTWYWWQPVSGTSNADADGVWRVKMYVDAGNGWEQVATEEFVMAFNLTQHLMGQDVQAEYPYLPISPTNVFYQTDGKAATWANFELVSNSLDIRWEFIEPNGALYSSPEHTSSDPNTSGYEYWSWLRAWAWISINGASAANKCGPWEVKVYIKDSFGNWEEEYADSFQIRESPNVVPSISILAAPEEPVKDEIVTLTVSAADNTYLERVDLYWFDGTWHQVALGDSIYANAFDSSPEIGPFAAGQQIEFYAVAVDSSGNAAATEIQTILICASGPPSDLDCDGFVCVSDLVLLLDAFGTTNPDVDITGDGTVNVLDLIELLLAFGPCP